MSKKLLSLLPCLWIGLAQAEEAAANQGDNATLVGVPAAVAEVENLTLSQCEIRQNVPGKMMTAAYFVLNKKDDSPLELLTVSFPALAGVKTELHEMKMQAGKMQMQAMSSYPVAQGQNVFARGGNHVMLFDLPKDLNANSTQTMQLQFNDKQLLTCQATIVPVFEEGDSPTQTAHDHAAHDHTGHSHAHGSHNHSHAHGGHNHKGH